MFQFKLSSPLFSFSLFYPFHSPPSLFSSPIYILLLTISYTIHFSHTMQTSKSTTRSALKNRALPPNHLEPLFDSQSIAPSPSQKRRKPSRGVGFDIALAQPETPLGIHGTPQTLGSFTYLTSNTLSCRHSSGACLELYRWLPLSATARCICSSSSCNLRNRWP